MRHGSSRRFRTGESKARRQRLRSGKMDWVRLRARDGSPRHDPLRYPGHPALRAERSALSSPVRMKFSANWLREFVDLPPKLEELTELLTMAGVEIEGVEQRGGNFDHVVVAQIT